MTTLEQILNESDDCSILSAQLSFTLQDILLEPDELIEDQILQEEDYDDMFDDDEQQEILQQSTLQVTNNKSNPEVNTATPNNALPNGNGLSKKQSEKVVEQQPVKKIIARQRRLKDMQLPSPREVNNMTFIVLKNVTALFQNPESKGVGIPTVISATGTRFLAVGTSMGNIALFQIGVKGYKILGNPDHKNYGQITTVAISRDNRYLIGGQQKGLLTVWDLSYFSQLKKQVVGKAKIIKLLFCSQNQFILNDIEGNIYLYTIQKYLWVNLKSQRLFQKTDSYFYDIKAHTLSSNNQILALCTLDNVIVLSFKPKVTAIAKFVRPQDLYFSKLPNIQLGRCAVFSVYNPERPGNMMSDVLCISWSRSIFVYKFSQTAEHQSNGLELVHRFQQQTPIFNMQFISSGILVTLDNRQTFRTYRLWVNQSGGSILINERQLPEEVVYQRFLKDKTNKYIKSFNNTIISCSFNPKDKEIFFICKNSIYRCRIHRWNDAMNQLINQDRQFQRSLKLCLELYNRRFNIFLQPLVINQKAIKLFCEIGRLFLVEKLKQIEKINSDRVKNIDQKSSIKLVQVEVEQTYDCLIEFMIEIKSLPFLFQKIYQDIIKHKHFMDQYHFKFLDCLQSFIMNGFLTIIPNLQLFKQITSYFLKKGKKNLLDNLIISLQIQSIFYPQAIEICESNKLYRSLAYVCSTHSQFIPPLNKLLREIVFSQINGHYQALEIYYMILKDYIIKLLGGVYINGSPFRQDPSTMKKCLSTWLTCKQTFTFFAKNVEQKYQKDYFYFLQGMIQSLNEQQSSRQYIHAILKQLIKQKHKEKQIAELFIKISSTVTLDEEEINIIVIHSDEEIIYKNINDYFEFIKRFGLLLKTNEETDSFLRKNKQINYFYYLIRGEAKNVNLLEKSGIQVSAKDPFNEKLAKFILEKQNSFQIREVIEDLLKIDSESAMVYMLEKFSLQIVNERIMTIKDEEYRYLVIRKLLSKLRKDKISLPTIKAINKSVTSSKMSLASSIFKSEKEMEKSAALSDESQKQIRRLGKDVHQFYMKCLCKYKHEKKTYYEVTSNIDDYADNLDNIIKIIEPYQYHSCLGFLEESRKNYQTAFKYYEKVYKHYFFEENYRKLVRVIHCHGRFMRKMFQRMLYIAQIQNKQQLWMDLLACVIIPLEEKSLKSSGKVCDDIQQVFKKKKDHPFLQQLAQILEICLTNVSNKVPIQNISNFIGAHREIFIKQFVLSSFRSTLVSYSKNAEIYLLANKMIINDQVTQFDQIYDKKIKGSSFSAACQECSQQLHNDSKAKIYSCGHAFHIYCHKKLRKLSSENGEEKEIFDDVDRCQKCIFLRTGGLSFEKRQQLPDFNIQEENMLYKGVKGIAQIIPSVIGAIPNPINIFTTETPTEQKYTKQVVNIDESQVVQLAYQYVAFEGGLTEKDEEIDKFLSDFTQRLKN